MNRPIIILGAGAHARVVHDCIEAMGLGSAVAGFLDACGPVKDGVKVHGLPVLGGPDDLARIAKERSLGRAALAFGDNRGRERLAAVARAAGLDLVTTIHPRASVSPRASIAAGAVVCAGAVVATDAAIGEGAIVNTGATVDHDAAIGAFAHVAPGAHLAGRVTMGERAFVGIGATVNQGRAIGADAVVGAAAAVIRDVAAGETVAGVPARPIGRR